MDTIVIWGTYTCMGTTSAILAFAGLAKVLRPRSFVHALKEYRLLPKRLIRATAVILPLVEIVLAILVLSAPNRLIAGLSSLLFLAFGAAIATLMLKGRTDVPCGCGISNGVIGWPLVFRNIAFAGLAVGIVQAGVKSATIILIVGLIGAALTSKHGNLPAKAGDVTN